MKRAAALLLLALAVGAPLAHAQTPWRAYRNDEQHFTVDLPGAGAAAMTATGGKSQQGPAFWTLIGGPPALPAAMMIGVRNLSQDSARVRSPQDHFRNFSGQQAAELGAKGFSFGEDHWGEVCGAPSVTFLAWPRGDRDHPTMWGRLVYGTGRVYTLTLEAAGRGATALRDRFLNSFRPIPCDGYTWYPTGEEFRHRLTSEALGFSLIGPGRPDPINRLEPGDFARSDGRSRMIMFADRSGSASSDGYTFDWFRHRAGHDPDDPQAWLDAWLKQQDDGPFTITVEQRRRLCGAPAVQYTRGSKNSSGGVRLLAVATRDTLFVLESGEGPQPTPPEGERRYFGSFELLPCPR